MLTDYIAQNYPGLNEQQEEAVGYFDGNLLVIAGPGSGKTTTLVLRAVNLILTGRAAPNEVALCTFSQKAAQELQYRFNRVVEPIADAHDWSAVSIGTIHGLCQCILDGDVRIDQQGSGPRLLDNVEQTIFIRRELENIASAEQIRMFTGRWGYVGTFFGLADAFNAIAERGLDVPDMLEADNRFHRAIAECYLRYVETLRRCGQVDFSHLQRWAAEKVAESEWLPEVIGNLRWLMVDEYQDTNHVQERLLLALAARSVNITAVGDDDQAIYGFRGAEVRNLLDFTERFPNASVIKLFTNYRSEQGIVDACNSWIEEASADNTSRFPKHITGRDTVRREHYPSVVRIHGANLADEARQVAALVRELKGWGAIERFSDVALLLDSVKPRVSGPYVQAFQSEGVPYTLHGGNRYFEYRQVRDMVACFAMLMGWDGRFSSGDREFDEYVEGAVRDFCARVPSDTQLARSLFRWHRELAGFSREEEELGRNLLDYFYVLMALEPFAGAAQARRSPLAMWSRLLVTFQDLLGYTTVVAGHVGTLRTDFFAKFLPLVYRHGTGRHQWKVDEPPVDGVQIMTVHQSKGSEFPVVISGNLRFDTARHPRQNELARYAAHWDPEREYRDAGMDRVRLQYVAFTRSRNLLVLGSSAAPNQDMPEVWCRAADVTPEVLERLRAKRFTVPAEPEGLRTYTVTGDILTYETCPRRYEYLRHHGFAERETDESAAGSLLHACLAIICEFLVRDHDPMEVVRVVDRVVDELAADVPGVSGQFDVDEAVVREVKDQVKGFLVHIHTAPYTVLDYETEVSYEGDGWRVDGRIDMMGLQGDQVLVIDFKRGRLPADGSPVVERYARQLGLYGLMVDQSFGYSVGELMTYWTGEDPGGDGELSIEYVGAEMNAARERLWETVERIEARKFEVLEPPALSVCQKCELFTVCKKDGTITASH